MAINPDGTISIDALKDIAGNAKKWREVGPLLYREVDGQTHTKFMTDDAGNVSYWVSDDFLPVEEFQRVSGLGQMSYLRLFGGISMGVLFLTTVIWFAGWIVRRPVHFRRGRWRSNRRNAGCDSCRASVRCCCSCFRSAGSGLCQYC